MKLIKSIILDTSNLSYQGETRTVTIKGEDDAIFSLYILNEDGYYYNFRTKLFAAEESGIENQMISGDYTNTIDFPAVSDNDHYDVRLWARDINNTKHANYIEARRADGSVDINQSTGSNSNLLTKKIYQYTVVTLRIGLKPGPGTDATFTPALQTINGTAGSSLNKKVAFSVTATAANDGGIQIIRQPTETDIFTNKATKYGSPVQISGEDLYEYSRPLTGTVNGATSSSNRLVFDETNTALGLVVGDAVTVTSAAGTYTDKTLLITHLNPDTDNANEIQLSASVSISDDAVVTFYYKGYYRWNIHADNSVHGFQAGMKIFSSTALSPFATLADYIKTKEITTEVEQKFKAEDYTKEPPKRKSFKTVVTQSFSAVEPTTLTYTDGVISKQLGFIVHDVQQYAAMENTATSIFAYGPTQIKSLSGIDATFSNLKVELKELTTTNSSAVSASASLPVADRSGFINNVTRIKAAGIDLSSGVFPLVTAGGGNDGAGTLAISAAQTIEDGQTITLLGSGSVVTVTGDIEIKTFPKEDQIIYIDSSMFLNIV